jgi:hypothetical protein
VLSMTTQGWAVMYEAARGVLERGRVLSAHMSFPSRGAKEGETHLALAEATCTRNAAGFATP